MNKIFLVTAIIIITIISSYSTALSEEKKGIYINPEQVKGVPANIVYKKVIWGQIFILDFGFGIW
jgi:hypothetical protein